MRPKPGLLSLSLSPCPNELTLYSSNQDQHYFKHMCDATDGCVIPGLYAMVGAAGALGGVTRMTGWTEIVLTQCDV